ncbi:MAG: hypothetical protein KDD39_10725 [Bdellovibrionales bacterium]|nr:hypothetical protein [Bdellovibrionales bacterium]
MPGGFVFPAFSDAISINPSYLLHEKRRNLSLFYEPPDSSTAPNQHDSSLSFASSNGRFGYGLKYENSFNDSTNQFDHNAALGFGMGTKEFALAVAVKLLTENSVLSHYVNLAFRYGKNGLYYQLVMHEVNADTYFEGGIGYTQGAASVEASMLSPHFSRLAVDAYRGSVAVALDGERFGAAARMSVTGLSLTVGYQFSVFVRPKEHIYLIFKYEDPRRIGFGLTLSF